MVTGMDHAARTRVSAQGAGDEPIMNRQPASRCQDRIGNVSLRSCARGSVNHRSRLRRGCVWVVAVAAVVSLVGCAVPTSPPTPAGAIGSAAPLSSATAGVVAPASPSSVDGGDPTSTPPGAAASASPSPGGVDLPNPGGTCTSDDIQLAAVASSYDFSTFGRRVVFVTATLRNVGAACALALPGVIAVASASGPFRAVTTTNTDAAGPARVDPGREIRLVLGDSWDDVQVLADAGRTPVPCAGEIAGVTRAVVPMAAGSLEVAWTTAWDSVCVSTSRVTIAFE